jgi:hypothetical protein
MNGYAATPTRQHANTPTRPRLTLDTRAACNRTSWDTPRPYWSLSRVAHYRHSHLLLSSIGKGSIIKASSRVSNYTRTAHPCFPPLLPHTTTTPLPKHPSHPDSARPRIAIPIHNNRSTPCPKRKNCTTRRDKKGPNHRHRGHGHTMTRTNKQTAKSITRGIRHQPIE